MADLDDLTFCSVQLRHHPGIGAGQFDQGLGGFDLDEDLVDRHGVTGFDLPGGDIGLGQSFADIRQVEGTHGLLLGRMQFGVPGI